MAHMILDNMIAWKNEVPWHGLGVEVPADADGITMLQAAKMDWTVQRRSIAMRDSKGNEMITAPLSGYRAIVRSDNDNVFQVSTDRYHVVQNREVIDLFRSYCDAGHATMETVGGLNGGAQVWALARLNGGSTAFLGDDKADEVRGYILMATSHDGSLRTIAKTTQVRVVCHNTLSAALRGGAEFKMKHSTKWTPERADEARAALEVAMGQIIRTNELSAELSKISISNSDWLDFMGRLLGGADNVIDPKTASLTKMANDIEQATLTSPGSSMQSAKGTLWGAVNGVTYFADHMRGRTQDSRLQSAWFGDSDLLKRTAMRTAADMAGVAY